MRVVALAFALTLFAAGGAVAGCWSNSTHTADAADEKMTTAQAPIQTPVPAEDKSDS